MEQVLFNKNIKNQPVQNNKSVEFNTDSIDPIFLAWYYMKQSVSIEQQTAQNQSNELNENANLQERINNEISSINYIQINPKDKDSTYIPTVQAQNQQIQKMIDNETSSETILRQQAQMYSTNANTSVNNSQQSAQEGASLLQDLTTMTREEFR